MPNQPKTTGRHIRVPDDLWAAVKTRAAEQGETVTDVAVRAFKAYVQQDEPTTTGSETPA